MKALKLSSIALFAALMCMAAVHCSKNANPASQTNGSAKTMNVAFSIKTNQEFNRVAASAVVTVTSSDMDSIRQAMVITDSAMFATVHDVPVGTDRLFEIFVYDSSSRVRYYGSQRTNIDPLTATYVTIKLHKPTSGDVVVIGIIEDDTMPGVTVTTPYKPYALVTQVSDSDTGAYVFETGGSWCSNGDSVEYAFTFLRQDTAFMTGYDTAMTLWAWGSKIYKYLPYPGTYYIFARARSATGSSGESNLSKPLVVKAVSPYNIVVLDSIQPDSSGYYDTLPYMGPFADTTWYDTLYHVQPIDTLNDSSFVTYIR